MRTMDQPEAHAYHLRSYVPSSACAMAYNECLNSRNAYVQVPDSDYDKETD